MKKKIAILGATSHIAKGLILNFLKGETSSLFLFARTPGKIKDFLKINSPGSNPYIQGFNNFQENKYDAIINCVGLGTPDKVREANGNVFKLTEEFDNLVLKYLRRHPKTIYINFSSGAVHTITPGAFKPEHFYGIAKLYQEARHRALDKLHIVDIRVFSYFSRFIELDSGYFLTELIKSISEKKVFITTPCDFTRDFLSSEDLFSLVCLIIKAKPFNDVVEAYSLRTVNKFGLLDYFAKNYFLKYTIKQKVKLSCPTGQKDRYFSISKKASYLLGYKPKFSSLETVVKEAGYLLNG